MTRTESTGPYSMVRSGSSRAPTGPQPRGRPCPAHRNSFHRHMLLAAWAMWQSPQACRRPDPRDRGVDVAPAGRDGDVECAVAVESDRTQLRLPAPGEQRASRQQNRRGGALASADGHRKWRRASRRARSLRSRAGAGADIARARPRARAPAACAAALRAQRQGRPKLRRMRGGRPGWGAHLWMLVGDEVDRGVDRLARILVPWRVHCDVCAWRVVCERSGVCCGWAIVLSSRGGWGRRGRDLGGDRTWN